MIFRSRNKKLDPGNDIVINGCKSKQVQTTKFLGVIIYCNLTWKYHISYVCSNISKNIGILIKPIKVFDTNTLLTLCYFFIYPYLNYCVHLWGSTYDTYVNKIFLLWKKVVHITHGVNLRAPNEPLFSSLYVLSVRMYTCIILDFLCMNTIMDYWQIYSTCSNKTWIYAWSFRLQMHVHMWFRWWGHHAVRLRLCFCLFK